MSDLAALTEQAERWVESDPDPETQRELLDLLSRAQTEPDAARELTERFSGTLGFGTAGLRAALGAGPMRMNRVVVAKAAHGLAAYSSQDIERIAGLASAAAEEELGDGFDGVVVHVDNLAVLRRR